MYSISLIIPAYNEEKRIKSTLETYYSYFSNLQQQEIISFQIIVVLNGCTDNTLAVTQEVKKTASNIAIISIPTAGKGLAIKQGFIEALKSNNQLIGFVDADMATDPEAYFDLIKNI